jgi:hypothetical protein
MFPDAGHVVRLTTTHLSTSLERLNNDDTQYIYEVRDPELFAAPAIQDG